MAREIGVNPDYDYLLDPQMQEPGGYCDRCGRILHGDGRRTKYEVLCPLCWEDLYGRN